MKIKPDHLKFTKFVAFVVTEDVKNTLVNYAKRRRLSVSKVARDLMMQGMAMHMTEIGSAINDKQR